MKTALITGASSGIGAAAARHLVARGFRVILVARGRDGLEAVAKDLGEAAVVEPCDAASGEQSLALAARVRAAYGAPDVLLHCAGAGQWKFIEDTSPTEAQAMMKAPYHAAFNLSHAFMKEMIARRSGVLIFVNSPSALFPWPSAVGYTAARWALRGLHESLCQDLAGTGVHSCHVVFGRVNSPYLEHNPGIELVMPRISSTVRTMESDECGRVLARVAEHPRRQLLHPFMLRLYGWCFDLVPGLVSWLLRATGARH